MAAGAILFVLGSIVIFVTGGLTGVMVALVPFDWQAHDTYFIVAHLHYVLIGGMLSRRLPTAMRGIASIVTGSIAGQGLVILSYPLLTRLYDPAELGLLTVFTSVVGMVGVVSAACLEPAVPIPPDDGEAADVAWAALAAVAGTTILTAVVGFLVAGPLAEVLGVPALAHYWWLVAVTVCVLGVYMVLSEWMVRDRTYGALGRRNLFQGVGQVVTQVGLGLAGVRPLGLLLGVGVGRALAMSGDPADRNLAKSIAAFVRDMPSTQGAEQRRQAPEATLQVKPADIGPRR